MLREHDAESWLDAVVAAAGELAETTFGSEIDGEERTSSFPKGLEGSLLPMQHGDSVIQLAVLASHDGCVDLTKALLQMEDGEEPDDDSIPDAVGEIVNILAGIVQRRIAEGGGPTISLGLPVYVRGDIYTTHKSHTAAANLDLGPARANLVVVHGDLHPN